VFVQGYADHFTVEWDTPISYPGYTVVMFIRRRDGSGATLLRQSVTRDDGIITSHLGLAAGEFYEVWGRAESLLHYGNWQQRIVLIDPAWSSDSEFVTHLGEVVMHGDQAVLVG